VDDQSYRCLFEVIGLIYAPQKSAALSTELLNRYNKKSETQANTIVSLLVRGYPSHSFVIDLPEAQKIGLSAREPNADEARIMDEIYERILNNAPLQKHGILKH
jgi:hypothetical protein